MKRKSILAAVAAVVMFLTTCNDYTIPVVAAEQDVNENALEAFAVEEIEIPDIEVSETIYNAVEHESMGESFKTDMKPFALEAEEDNTDPSNAVELTNGTTKTNALSADQTRWYFCNIMEESTLTLRLEMDSTIDADLYLFALDTESGNTQIVANSLREGVGLAEGIKGTIDPGVYLIAVNAYEGEGNFILGFYTSTVDLEFEENDTPATATEVSGVFDINGIDGVLDSPYDYDFYKLTLSEASAVRFELKYTSDKYAVYYYSGSALYAIKDNLYALDEGTHYFVVLSTDGSFSSTRGYNLNLTTIAPISKDDTARFYAVCDRANIVFQFNKNRTNFYVNGNEIDFSYSYNKSYSSSSGSQSYDISLTRTSNMNVCLTQTESDAFPIELQQTIPDVLHILNSSFTGKKDMYVLVLSVFDLQSPCYKVHVRGTKDYSDITYWQDFNTANVYIDPSTGKVIDIQWYNYFYENANYKITTTRPYQLKYYYGYWNGEEPEGGDD